VDNLSRFKLVLRFFKDMIKESGKLKTSDLGLLTWVGLGQGQKPILKKKFVKY
jgi:hypothetical protein